MTPSQEASVIDDIHFSSFILGTGPIGFTTISSTESKSPFAGTPVASAVLTTSPSSASCCVTGTLVQLYSHDSVGERVQVSNISVLGVRVGHDSHFGSLSVIPEIVTFPVFVRTKLYSRV